MKRFRLKDEYLDSETVQDRHQLGWIAQDVMQVFPKSVTSTPKDAWGIPDLLSLDTDQIMKCLYGAVGHVLEENDALKDRVHDLETQVAAQNDLLASMNSRLAALESQ